MTVIAEGTRHVSGLARSRGGSGDPSPYTALGVETAVLASLERALGSSSLKGRSAAVVGLGHVGLRVAQLLARGGAKLIVSDIDRGKREEAARLGAKWATPAKAMAAPVDVLVPCALGGVLDHESVPALQAPAIAGAGNNQLAARGVDGLVQDRGILCARAFVANAGGIVNIAVELEASGYDAARARARTTEIGDTLRRIYDDAATAKTTPLQAATALAHERLGAR